MKILFKHKKEQICSILHATFVPSVGDYVTIFSSSYVIIKRTYDICNGAIILDVE